jgi:hypothetical protein
MKMTPDHVAMLVGGIVLFLVALGLLVYCVSTRRSTKPVLPVLLLAIIMIGFPSIKYLQIFGTVIELNNTLAAVEKNPNNPAARASLEEAVARVSREPNITPTTRATLANAQFALGRIEEATNNAKSALNAQPNLKINPSLRALAERPSPPR